MRFFFITVVFFSLTLYGCGFYSFIDSSIPEEIKTIRIEQFTNSAAYVNVDLANDITAEFRNLVASQTNLVQTSLYVPDLIISGKIITYDVKLLGINTQSQKASQNQLTTVLHLSVKNNLEDKSIYKDIDERIQILKEFDANVTFGEVEVQLNREIRTEMANLIFSKAFSNW